MLSAIQSTILTPGWWISSVVGVVLLGLIGMYLKDGIDRLFKLLRVKWTHRSQAARDAFEAEVGLLRTDADMRNRYFQDETRNRLRTNLCTIQSVGNLLVFAICAGYFFAVRRGLAEEFSAAVTIGAAVLSIVTGLASVVGAATALVAHSRATNVSDRLIAAQCSVDGDKGAA